MEVEAWLGEVKDHRHLVRERALQKLRGELESGRTGEDVVEAVRKGLATEGLAWEERTGLMLAAKHMLSAEGGSEYKEFAREMVAVGTREVSDEEVRLRTAAGELLGACAKVLGVEAWNLCAGGLISYVEANFALDEAQRNAQAARKVENVEGLKKNTNLVHESEGWRNLDTSLVACTHIVGECGEHVVGQADTGRLVDFALRAREHPNRFVRETSLKLLTAFVVAASASDAAGNSEGAMAELAPKIADSVATGLQDNWSQVRYASSVCVRELLSRTDESVKEPLYPLLIPRMCLNRHYVAEGVRIYSQDTWRNVLGARGRPLLVKYFADVIAYYESQCDADNHAVREAACQGLAELCTRIEPEVVEPEVERILRALLVCFRDESWPVRDCACTASSIITSKFPSIVEKTGLLTELVELWSSHIADNIPSVRENSAVALTTAASAYREDHPVCGVIAVSQICQRILPAVYDQPQDSSRYGTLGKASQYGAAHKLARDNDETLHTNQTMYSCGSLAPKLRKGGCMDHGFRKAKEPWEESDGALRLWRRITELAPAVGEELLPTVVGIAQTDLHFAHAPYLLETLWLQFEAACPKIDKDKLSKLLPPLAAAVEKSKASGHNLTRAAATRAGRALTNRMGAEAMRAALPTSA